MNLKILHSSDWHLGITLENQTREQEHKLFLEWVSQVVEQEQINILIVSGDLFHYAQPSADAQKIYYQFLAKLNSYTSLKQIVIVGGNHDSASRLEAPAEILRSLNIHLVGGINSITDIDKCLCPIYDDSGKPELVIVAVPFIHEFRLGIRTTGRSPEEISEDFYCAYKKLYSDLADLAHALYPEVSLVATGHMTCLSATQAELADESHQIGTISGLSPDIFDLRYSYVALGHIHRMFPVDGSRAWYSGSPIPLNLKESQQSQYLLLLEFYDSQPKIRSISIPRWREILEVKGELITDLLEQLISYRTPSPLPPFVYVELAVEHYEPHLAIEFQTQYQRLLAEQGKERKNLPIILSVRQILKNQTADFSLQTYSLFSQKNLTELKPEEIFECLYQTRYQQQPPKEISSAFRTLVSSLYETS